MSDDPGALPGGCRGVLGQWGQCRLPATKASQPAKRYLLLATDPDAPDSDLRGPVADGDHAVNQMAHALNEAVINPLTEFA